MGIIVDDEGEHWETENSDTLVEKREFLQGKINALAGALEAADGGLQGATLDEIVAHIEQTVRKL
jgi:hypothetical protein